MRSTALTRHIPALLFLSLLLTSCTTTAPEDEAIIPGIGSEYRWVSATTDEHGADPTRYDTARYTIAAAYDHYLGESDVLFADEIDAPLYIRYTAEGGRAHYQASVFPVPGTFVARPAWITFPFTGEPTITRTLLDTIDPRSGGLHLIATVTAERVGEEEATVDGAEHRGIRVDYAFRYEIVEEQTVMIVEGSTLHIPAIGWPALTTERTTMTIEGDTVRETRMRGELAGYVVLE